MNPLHEEVKKLQELSSAVSSSSVELWSSRSVQRLQNAWPKRQVERFKCHGKSHRACGAMPSSSGTDSRRGEFHMCSTLTCL